MNFDREAWRPLFVREPVSQRGWNLVTRGLRAYLIRVAEDDGTLLKRCSDPFELAASLAAHAEEMELVRGAIGTLLRDGFLQWAGDADRPGWLGVDRLVTFGAGHGEAAAGAAVGSMNDPEETPEARRRRLARERQSRSRRRDMSRVTSVTEGVTASVTESVTERDQRDLSPHTPLSEIDETIGEERESGARASERAQRDMSRVTSVTEERDSPCDRERDVSRVTEPRDSTQGTEAQGPLHERIPAWWKPSQEFYDEALLARVPREVLDEDVTYWRGRKLGGEWFSIEQFFRAHFARLAKRRETEDFKQRKHGSAQPNAGKTGWEHLEGGRR